MRVAPDHLLALFGAVTVTTGCFLPWINLGPLERMKGIVGPVRGIVDPFSGLRGPYPADSFILLFVGSVAVCIAGYAVSNEIWGGRRTWSRGLSLFYLLSGMFTVGLAYLELRDVLGRASETVRAFREFSRAFAFDPLTDVGVLSFVGVGLYPALAGGLCLLSAGAWAFMAKPVPGER